jgi:hypothetical protein
MFLAKHWPEGRLKAKASETEVRKVVSNRSTEEVKTWLM